MARLPKPWFWKARNAYFVTVRGVRHPLGANKAEAERQFHQLMATPPPAPASTSPSVASILDAFLDWCKTHRKPRTFEFYRDHLQAFVTHLGESYRKDAGDLRPFDVIRWADSQAGWGACRKRGAITAVQRAYNWAVGVGLLLRSPITKVEKPAAVRREQTVSVQAYKAMLAKVRPPIRDLLTLAWETGARPQELFRLEARHYHPDRGRLELPPAEAKGGKRWRAIYLTPAATAIVVRLVSAHPSGVLLRNCDGVAWNKHSVNCVFRRLRSVAGAKHALYDFRHSFAQRKLEEGHDHLTVAELLGHKDGRMLSTTYSHMNKADCHLRRALNGDGDTANNPVG